jgi:hypothetical protein
MPAPILIRNEDFDSDPFLYPSQLKFRALDAGEKKFLKRQFDDFLPHEDEIIFQQSIKKMSEKKFALLAEDWYTTPDVLAARMEYLNRMTH